MHVHCTIFKNDLAAKASAEKPAKTTVCTAPENIFTCNMKIRIKKYLTLN